MRNDQRLIPFLGGLVIGGVGGAAAESNKPMYNNSYYPPYYYNGYSQPYYTTYQYQPNNNFYPHGYNQQSLPVNSSSYPQAQYSYQYQYQTDVITPGKLLDEEPVPIVIKNDTRDLNDISYVPKYM